MKKTAILDFTTAFKYPFNRSIGLLNILWIFLPIIGWFALGGYTIRIVQEFCKGKFSELPSFKFSQDLHLGVLMFLKSIPFILVYGILIFILTVLSPWIAGIVRFFLSLFVVPILTINFFTKQTIISFFEIEIIKSVFDNFVEYIIVVLKTILLTIVFFLMWIVLVGIPAGTFTQYIFLADFYRRKVQ
ncbi:DUF4013 domain-containing protein [Candidatus Woesearchaeota archaeon]|jgi:hypothetical protein|nr:DUF4013 domain-containing protein [Candidatus Woesearchaeota archaeon]MBT5396987.1 DUF4013 domain-containing protein [Candidatus Woesearchaeota archaeon]MBT6367467.1 DUF4013 domain-containing protein [Candidatus Woesearchaeota archaeon]MBT7762387.1 DUF4013 domain-containing protein [Candidatus Woesearchaeota archaeon]